MLFRSHFRAINFKLFCTLTDLLEKGVMVSFAINLQVKLCINSDITVSFSFLNNIKGAIDNELRGVNLEENSNKTVAREIIDNTYFFKWLLDLAFQEFLTNSVQNYKPGFIITLDHKDKEKTEDNELHMSQISDNFIKAQEIIIFICRSNILQLDYLLTWGNYYKILYEQDRNYYNQEIGRAHV